MSNSVLNLIADGEITGQYADDVLLHKLRFEVRHQRNHNEEKCQQATRLLCQHMYDKKVSPSVIASSLITIITK